MIPGHRRDVLVVVTCAVAALFVLMASPARAAASRIGSVTQDRSASGTTLHFTYSTDQPVTDLTVELDGKQAPATVQPVSSTSTAVDRSAALVIDTSGSMAGAGIASARTAAVAFLDSMPGDVRVGIFTAGQPARMLLPPTRDRATARTVVNGLQAAGETCLYDAVNLAVGSLGSHGERLVVVLSDGADTRSKTSFAAAQATVSRSGDVLDAVAYRTTASVADTLGTLARSGHGHVVRAEDARAVTAAFTGSGRKLSAELAVDVPVPAALAGRTVQLSVHPKGAATPVDTTTVQILPALVAAKDAPKGTWHPPVTSFFETRTGLLTGLGLLFVAVVASVGSFGSLRTRRRTRDTLDAYRLATPVTDTSADGEQPQSRLQRMALNAAAALSTRLGVKVRVANQLDAAGMRMSADEFLLMQALIGVVVVALLALLLHSLLAGVLVGAVLALALPPTWLAWRVSRRRAAFVDGLPDALQLVSSSLVAGYSLPQALDGLVREGSEPVSTEIGRALATARLGIPVEDGLEVVAERMRCEDFGWAVMAIRIQREVGGNLAEVLRTVAATLRERAALRRHIRALSAEARLSARILLGLPVLLAGYEFMVRRSYIKPLYTDPLGIALSIGTVVWMGVGVLWMRKVTRIEV